MSNSKTEMIEREIDRYLNGELSDQEIEDLWAEVIQDEYYMQYMKNMSNLRAVGIEEDMPEPRSYGWMYAAAAAILLVIAVLGMLQFMGPAQGDELHVIDTIELDYYRSAPKEMARGEKEKIIQHAIELYNRDEFSEAVDLLEEEREKASDAPWIAELDITLGTFYYNEDQFRRAASFFEDVISYKDEIDMLVLEKAYWYLGNSYVQMNELLKAEEFMQKAHDINGAYSRVTESCLNAIEAVKKK